ncbi:hypothetical protein PGAL8A_00130300 [Plasmodium gallinaceum]|uniref:Surface-associated interspersed protein (SURFIN) n=1 Tax=Plasmodium gallinaceum TaxID=5849 RepID=A0A1J1GME1_PLAGA|nr:hypothetical protein PGAL8A_00130300 [Plasmodium gallinaceum]CRG93598.1 hypothetical protein PGAL8A_00130300 [Plasmodium gallinaceum]
MSVLHKIHKMSHLTCPCGSIHSYSNNTAEKTPISSLAHKYSSQQDDDFDSSSNKYNLIKIKEELTPNKETSTKLEEKELDNLLNLSSNLENSYSHTNILSDAENLLPDLESVFSDLSKISFGLDNTTDDKKDEILDLDSAPVNVTDEVSDLEDLLNSLDDIPFELEKTSNLEKISIDLQKTSADFKKLLDNLIDESHYSEKEPSHYDTSPFDLDKLLDDLENMSGDIEKVKSDLEKKLTDSENMSSNQEKEPDSQENMFIDLQSKSFNFDDISLNLEEGSNDLENDSLNLDEFIFDLENEPFDSFIKRYCLDSEDDEKQNTNSNSKRKGDENIKDDVKRQKIDNEENNSENKTTKRNITNKKSKDKSCLNFNTIEYEHFELYLKNFMDNAFPIKLTHISENAIPLLQEIFSHIKSTHNEFRNMFTMIIQSLKILINTEMKNIDVNYKKRMRRYYDSLYANKRLHKKSSYMHMKKFTYPSTYTIPNEGEIYLNMAEFIKNLQLLLPVYEKFKETANILTYSSGNLTCNQLFTYPKLHEMEDVTNTILNALKNIDETIKTFEISCKERKSFNEKTMLSKTKGSLEAIMSKVRRVFRYNLRACLRYLKVLNLTNKEEKILTDYVFYNFNQENSVRKKNLEDHSKDAYNKKVVEALDKFLLLESENALKNHKKTDEIFNVDSQEKSSDEKSLEVLIKTPLTSKVLSNIYKNFVELMKITYFKEKLTSLIDICESLQEIITQEKRNMPPRTKKKKWFLLDVMENMKIQFNGIKEDFDKYFMFNSLQKNIEEGNEKIMQAYHNFTNIKFIFQNAARIIYWHISRETSLEEQKKTIKKENVLFALFFINQVITDRTIEEIP